MLLEKLFVAAEFVLLHFAVDHLAFFKSLNLILLQPNIGFLLLSHHLTILLLGKYLPLQLQPVFHSQLLGMCMPLCLFLLKHKGIILIDLGPLVLLLR